MFGIGMTELLVIMAVALVVFGPKRLPELARSMGKALGEFRQASTDLRQTLSETPPPVPGPAESPGAPIAPQTADPAKPPPAESPPALAEGEDRDDDVHHPESDDEDAEPVTQGAGEPARKDPPA